MKLQLYHTILIVDDQPAIQHLFTTLLEAEGYSCLTAPDGEEALTILKNISCSLLIADIDLPKMNGVELLAQVDTQYPDLAVIMMSGAKVRKEGINCLQQGAFAHMSKPFSFAEIRINVTNALRRRELEITNRHYQQKLEQQVKEKTKDLQQTSAESLEILSRTAEFRDNETARHNTRMGLYCELLAKKIGLPRAQCDLIRAASPLHDVGKIGIPDEVLLKPGKLTTEEFTVIKTHCVIGCHILSVAKSEILQLGATIAHSHHEKFDGSGYPRGLQGKEIPIESRIATICDVFDALTTKRVYKEALSVDQALQTMDKEHRDHFDPDLFDTFLSHINDMRQIKLAHQDTSLHKVEFSTAA